MNKKLYLIFLKNTPPPRPDTHPHTQPNPSLTFPDLADMGYSDGFQVSPLKRILSSSFPKPLLTSHFFFHSRTDNSFLIIFIKSHIFYLYFKTLPNLWITLYTS